MKVACTVLEGESGGNPADLLRYIRLNYKRQKRYITSRNTYSFLLPIYNIGT